MPGDAGDVVGGAASGAAIGSVAGPWGAAAGGVIGGLGGYFLGGSGSSTDPANAQFQDREMLRRMQLSEIGSVNQRYTPRVGAVPQLQQARLGQAAQLDPAQQAQVRAMQMEQAGRLGRIASGQERGAGEMAVGRQIQQAGAQQQAMARMQRGMSGASAARGAARNMAGLGVSGAGQAAQSALSDQMGAGQQLGSLLGQTREQDIGFAGQNAQMNQQRMMQQGTFDQQRMMQQGAMSQNAQMANLNAQLQARGMDDQARLAYMQQLMSMNQAEMAARLGQEQVAMNAPSLTGPMLQAGGQVLAAYAANQGGGQAASDARVKKNIAHGGAEVDSMLDALKPSSYEYIPGGKLKQHMGGMGDGRRLAGILAQDLEKSAAGKAIVSDTAEGKTIDVVGGLSALFASVARLNERDRARDGKR